jgi:glycine/D-amino acid oxidase-like deaminating enzyme
VSAGEPAPDVAIVGGGIVGTALAAFLAEAGLRVRLYERAAIAAGASGRNSGIVQHPFDPVLAGLYWASLVEYRALAASAPSFALPREAAGLLYVGRDRPLATRVAAEWAATWPDARPEVVEGAALAALEPALAPDLIACRLAIGYPVGPAAATIAFADRARRGGVEVVIGEEVALAREGDRVVGVAAPGGTGRPAGEVVVAAGPWSPAIVDPRGTWRPIRPVWGVVVSVALAGAPRHGLEASDIDIEPGSVEPGAAEIEPSDDLVDFSLVPGDGSSALGSTFLPVEPEPGGWVDALRRVGARYVPAVADAPVLGVRHCARPVSRDGRPLVGRVPWLDGLWIAAGHGPWGISTGPGTARLLADRILDRTDDAAIPAALRPDRFGRSGPI